MLVRDARNAAPLSQTKPPFNSSEKKQKWCYPNADRGSGVSQQKSWSAAARRGPGNGANRGWRQLGYTRKREHCAKRGADAYVR